MNVWKDALATTAPIVGDDFNCCDKFKQENRPPDDIVGSGGFFYQYENGYVVPGCCKPERCFVMEKLTHCPFCGFELPIPVNADLAQRLFDCLGRSEAQNLFPIRWRFGLELIDQIRAEAKQNANFPYDVTADGARIFNLPFIAEYPTRPPALECSEIEGTEARDYDRRAYLRV